MLDVSYATSGEQVSLGGCTGRSRPDVVYCPPASALVAVLLPPRGNTLSCRKSPGHPVQNHWFADAHRGACRIIHSRQAAWDVRHDRELRCTWLYTLYGVEGYAAEYPGALRSAVHWGDLSFASARRQGRTGLTGYRDAICAGVSDLPHLLFSRRRIFFTRFRWPGAASQVQCCRNPPDYQATEWCQGTLVKPARHARDYPGVPHVAHGGGH